MWLTKSLHQYTSHDTTYHIVKEDSANYKPNKSRTQNKKFNGLKRIPIHRLMDLKIDYAFKQLFGVEKNKQITIVFLNAILQKTGRASIKDITFADIEAGGEYLDDKQSRLDLLVITETGERINIEIQFTDKYEMISRSIYYWSGIYRNQLRKGMVYGELNSVISINVMNFDLFGQTKRFHTTYHLYEDEEKFKLTNAMEFHYIEMPKLLKAWKEEKLDPWNDILARWLLLLGMVDHRNNQYYQNIYKELEEIAMEDKTLKDAFHHWEELSMTPEEFLVYEARLKHILDEESAKQELEMQKQEVETRKQEMEVQKQEMEVQKQEVEMQKQEMEMQKQEMEIRKQEMEMRKQEIETRKREVDMREREVRKQELEMRKRRAELQEQEAERRAKEAQEEGKNEGKKLVAERLLVDGFEIDDVIKITDLARAEVLAIEKAMKE